MHWPKVIIAALLAVLFFGDANAQDTNPVDRQVANPITDTPNINPISAEQSIKAPKTKKTEDDKAIAGGEAVVYSEKQTVEGPDGKPMKMKMVTKEMDADHQTFQMFAPGPDGKESLAFTIEYTRRK